MVGAPAPNVLEPVADFFKGVFADAINFVMAPINAFESAISKVASLAKPLTDIIGGLTGTLKNLCFAHAAPAAEEFNKQVTSSIELSQNLTRKLDPLKNSLMGVAGKRKCQSSRFAEWPAAYHGLPNHKHWQG